MKTKKIKIKKMRFFNWCRILGAIIQKGLRGIWFG